MTQASSGIGGTSWERNVPVNWGDISLELPKVICHQCDSLLDRWRETLSSSYYWKPWIEMCLTPWFLVMSVCIRFLETEKLWLIPVSLPSLLSLKTVLFVCCCVSSALFLFLFFSFLSFFLFLFFKVCLQPEPGLQHMHMPWLETRDLGLRDDAQPTEPYQSGLVHYFLKPRAGSRVPCRCGTNNARWWG